MLDAEILQKSIYKFYKCLNAQFTHKTDLQNKVQQLCWFDVENIMLKFLISGSFLSEKKISDYYTIILVSFPLGGYVDDIVDSQANSEGYRYDIYFLGCHTFAVIHLVNDEGVC